MNFYRRPIARYPVDDGEDLDDDFVPPPTELRETNNKNEDKQMKIYYILNTVSEHSTTINGYFSSLEKAKDALESCCDWYRSYGTGRIYEVELNTKNYPKLVYKN